MVVPKSTQTTLVEITYHIQYTSLRLSYAQPDDSNLYSRQWRFIFLWLVSPACNFIGASVQIHFLTQGLCTQLCCSNVIVVLQ